MMNRHMSLAVAGATVHGMDAITATVQASERSGARRIEGLIEARENLQLFLVDVEAALAAEIAQVTA